MTTVPAFDYELAADLEAALAAGAQGATFIHGGTELLPAMSMGLLAPSRVVSLRAVAQLRHCSVTDRHLVLGAGLTHRDVATDPLIHEHAQLLAEVANGVGNIRVRSTGTVGGNLAFAEPRSDVIAALLALDAQVRLATLSARRELPLKDFLQGPYEVDLQPGELITSVALPVGATNFGIYRKIVRSERPIVGVALTHFTSGRWRLVVGAVGPEPTLVEAELLSGFLPAAIATGADATTDLNGSEAYKRHLTSVMVERCLHAAEEFMASQAEGGRGDE